MTREPLVSVFTASHEIGADIETAYRSLLGQTYANWEWVVMDDSRADASARHIDEFARAAETAGRMRPYRQMHSGSIGTTKTAAAALCRGEVLVELDHDDELLPDALDTVLATFLAYPTVDFAYSDWVDWLDGREPGTYPPGWGFGLGAYASEVVAGLRTMVALAPPVTPQTLSHLAGMPNHLRAWRASSYRAIGGHNPALPIADDYELLLRTFLYGTMARIPRPLYVQHHSTRDPSASRRHNAEIQNRVASIAEEYGTRIDARCLALGVHPTRSGSLTGADPIPSLSMQIDVAAQAATARGNPLISVVLPTYRRPELLRRAVESVLGQTHENLEILVVGDACPDVDLLLGNETDPRVRYSNLHDHYGDSGASPRNFALKVMARGDLIAYLDDDNAWRPRHLELLLLALHRSQASFAFASLDLDGEHIMCRSPRRYQIDTSGLIHRRYLLERFGYWRPAHQTDWAHDWELVSRWDGEPWAATLAPTVVYNLQTSKQGARSPNTIRAVAEEERLATEQNSPSFE